MHFGVHVGVGSGGGVSQAAGRHTERRLGAYVDRHGQHPFPISHFPVAASSTAPHRTAPHALIKSWGWLRVGHAKTTPSHGCMHPVLAKAAKWFTARVFLRHVQRSPRLTLGPPAPTQPPSRTCSATTRFHLPDNAAAHCRRHSRRSRCRQAAALQNDQIH